jgi:tetratricopeptide (TPR) repeat protein
MRSRRGIFGTLCLLTLWLASAPAAPAASGALSRGNEALEAGRYAEAEAALEEATRAEPKSAEAHHLLGLARLAQGDADGAVHSLDTAVALDPGRDGLWLSLGMARQQAGDDRGAETALERACAEQPRDGSAHYFLGLSRQKLGHHAQAIDDFRASAALDSDYEQLALFQIAVSQHEEGDAEVAAATLAQAIAADPESETASDARSLLNAFESGRETGRRWSVYGFTGIEFDDNVSVPELDASSDESDVAGFFEAGGRVRILDGSDYDLESSYDFYQSIYAEITEANLQSHALTLAGSKSFGPVDTNLDYNFAASWLGGDGFLNVHRVSPSLGWLPASRWYMTAGYDFRDKDFRIDSDRDAMQHVAVLRNLVLFGEKRTLDLLYQFEYEDARAAEFDYLGQTAGFRLATEVAPFGLSLDLEFGYRFAYRDYQDDTPSIGEQREDQRHFADVVIERRIYKLLTARLTYQHVTSISNLASADYSSNIVNLGVGFEY